MACIPLRINGQASKDAGSFLGIIMTTRIERIFKNARVTLADKDKQRWSDEDLLLLLDRAHKDFCRQTQILSGRVELPLVVGNAYFDLPDNVWLITRALYAGKLLPILSHTDIDHCSMTHRFRDFGIDTGSAWEEDTGSPQAILYDRRNLQECKVYPIPDKSIVQAEYTFADNPDVGFVGSGNLGVVVGIDDYSLSSEFGVVVDTYEPTIDREYYETRFGVVSNITENDGIIKLYYVRIPDTLETVEDELETPAMFDDALCFYVIGHAFMNDLNAEYQQKGAQQLTFYEREVLVGKSTETRDGTRTGTQHTNYRRVI